MEAYQIARQMEEDISERTGRLLGLADLAESFTGGAKGAGDISHLDLELMEDFLRLGEETAGLMHDYRVLFEGFDFYNSSIGGSAESLHQRVQRARQTSEGIRSKLSYN